MFEKYLDEEYIRKWGLTLMAGTLFAIICLSFLAGMDATLILQEEIPLTIWFTAKLIGIFFLMSLGMTIFASARTIARNEGRSVKIFLVG